MNVRVVTVAYGASAVVRRWADALERAWSELDDGGEDHHISVICVDNGPRHEAAKALAERPFITTLRQPANRGFAAGCNLALQTAKPGELLVVMNPDVIVRRDFFCVLASLPWAADLAARGPQVRDETGGLEQSARAFPSAITGLFGRTSLAARLFPRSAPVRRELRARVDLKGREVDWISGACMIIPFERLRSVGPFDEGYFMYWEDADWCRRANDLGLRVRHEPSLVVQHLQGSSSRQRPLTTVIQFHLSAFRYQRLHGDGGPGMQLIAVAAIAARAVVKLLGVLVGKLRR